MDNNNYNGSYVAPRTVAPSGNKNNTPIIAIIGVVCGVIGLGLGILNAVQIGGISQDVNSIKTDIYSDDTDDADVAEDDTDKSATCVLPSSVKEIDYLLVGYNNGKNQVFVDSDGEIDYSDEESNTSGDDTSSRKTVKTDTSAIMQQVFNDDLNNFTSASNEAYNDEGEQTWSWMVELWTTNGNLCQAGGAETTPGWFNSLIETINSKK